MRLRVDRDRCIGSSNCVVVMPDVFDQDEAEGLVQLLDDSGAGHDEDALHDVAYACPAQAIEVVEGG
ncbi:ferredoxin [Nocardioides caldifontis]|uniref:ferredoxin n=1 Tax=Nocardioides caldifontis TaxID=2588938 RepID=UPI0011DF93C6|nr:ferredoxin [Nocardioides caldifontis]